MAVLDAFDLSGKVAVVTDGNTGLGEAFAKALAEVGANVVVAARTRVWDVGRARPPFLWRDCADAGAKVYGFERGR